MCNVNAIHDYSVKKLKVQIQPQQKNGCWSGEHQTQRQTLSSKRKVLTFLRSKRGIPMSAQDTMAQDTARNQGYRISQSRQHQNNVLILYLMVAVTFTVAKKVKELGQQDYNFHTDCLCQSISLKTFLAVDAEEIISNYQSILQKIIKK